MKSLKSKLLVVAFALCTVFAYANSEDENANSVVIKEEIGKLLKNPQFLVDEDITASVLFTVNKHNELVVLSVDSNNTNVEGFIKERLNYQELPVNLKNGEKTFRIPVRVTLEE